MKTVNDVRNEFLSYFKDKGHEVVESSSLVPHNDPTLMFVNAGMVQFKDVFTGKEKRPYTRASSSQKCVRAGGKHNDLENVGYTARHHTFFEMLGNFSFGDYFKEEAIAFAWELVTKNFALDPEKLCVTVHSSDEEAAAIWKKITGFDDHKIIRIPTDDNFWRMGDTGPCGPCTEIFYDHGEDIWGGPPGSAKEDGDRFIEIWNNVFMQYEQIDADTRIDLPAQSVDTGMGLERMVATLMGSNNNYDIDIMRSLIEHSADLTSVASDGDMAASHKVIADHLRACAFLLADGVMPSNEGRGYVLRRIMRRAMRHAHLLGAKDPIMYQLFPTLISKMGEAYPELIRAQSLITQTLETEEKRFKTMLDRGVKMLDEETANLESGDKFSGAVAFKLYDTYGFPLDLTQDALRAKEIEVDTDTFDTCMAEQKAKARAAWSGAGGETTEKLWFDILDEFGATEFLGYDKDQAEAKVLAIIKKQYCNPVRASEGSSHALDQERDLKQDSACADIDRSPQSKQANACRGDDRLEYVMVDELNSVKEGDFFYLVTNQSPFYAESGGQIGDLGDISSDSENNYANVYDTAKKVGKVWVHGECEVFAGSFNVGDTISMSVDTDRRASIKANHSATHLLHQALRQVLGDHVTQKGSLQDAKRTRFDISQPVAITSEQLAEVEAIVNAQIRGNSEVITRLLSIDEARETGAMALFGEKYDDEVRVVSMGDNFSIELCGGTHVKRTGDIEKFKITSEGAVSSGIRRIEAVTGERVDAYLSNQMQKHQENMDRLHKEIKGLELEFKELSGEEWILDSKDDDEDMLVAHIKALKKTISKLRRKQGAETSDSDIKEIAGIKFTGRVLAGFPPKELKPMADDLKAKLGSAVIVLIATNEDKASIVVGVTDDLTAKINAVDLVRVGAQALGGKGGGGRPDMAQAGGSDVNAANDALTAIEKTLAG